MPDIIHEGHWDIASYKVADYEGGNSIEIQVDGQDITQYTDIADVILLEYVQDQIDASSVENTELQNQNQALQDKFNTVQYQLDKQAKKIERLEAALLQGAQ